MSGPCKVSPVAKVVRGVVVRPWSRNGVYNVEVEGEVRRAYEPEIFIDAEVSVEFDPARPNAPGRIVAVHHRRRLATGGAQ